jgi:ribonuclease P protein component
MVLYVAPVPGTPRAAFVAGRRVGTAVERNRARRVLREAWRRVRGSIPEGTGVVIVARGAILPARTQELETEMRQLLSPLTVEG